MIVEGDFQIPWFRITVHEHSNSSISESDTDKTQEWQRVEQEDSSLLMTSLNFYALFLPQLAVSYG